MGVVKIERMTERAVEQCRDRRSPRPVVAEHGGGALRIERQCFERLEPRGRGIRIAPGPDRAAEEIERQRLGALAYRFWNVLEPEIGDIGGEHCGFVGHLRCPCFRRVLAAISNWRPVASTSTAVDLLRATAGTYVLRAGTRGILAPRALWRWWVSS